MEAVLRGGDRQELHERIRRYSLAAQDGGRAGAARTRCSTAIAADADFRLHARRDRRRWSIPRPSPAAPPQQVDEFLARGRRAGARRARRRRDRGAADLSAARRRELPPDRRGRSSSRARSVASALASGGPSLACVAVTLAAGCASSRPRVTAPTSKRGVASWYGPGFHGRAHRLRRDLRHARASPRRTARCRSARSSRCATSTTALSRRCGSTTADRSRRTGSSTCRAPPRARSSMIGPGTARVELRMVRLGGSVRRATSSRSARSRSERSPRTLQAALRRRYPGDRSALRRRLASRAARRLRKPRRGGVRCARSSSAPATPLWSSPRPCSEAPLSRARRSAPSSRHRARRSPRAPLRSASSSRRSTASASPPARRARWMSAMLIPHRAERRCRSCRPRRARPGSRAPAAAPPAGTRAANP